MTKAMNLAPAATSHEPEAKSASFSAALTSASEHADLANPTMARSATVQEINSEPSRYSSQAKTAPKTAKPVANFERPVDTKARTATSTSAQQPVRTDASQGSGRGVARVAKAQPTAVDATVSLPRSIPVAAPIAAENTPAVAGMSEIADKVSLDARSARSRALDTANGGPADTAGAAEVAASPEQNGIATDQQDAQDAEATDAGDNDRRTPEAHSSQNSDATPQTKRANTAAAQVAEMIEAPTDTTTSATPADAKQVQQAVHALASGQAAANATMTATNATSLPAIKLTPGAKPADSVAEKSASTSSAPATHASSKAAANASATTSDGNTASTSQNSSAAGQHAQQDPQRPPAGDGNANPAAATQVQTAVSSSDQAHATTAMPGSSEANGAARMDPRTAAENLQQPTMTAGINASKLIQTMSTSEMHVGMRSAEFGDISIRTAVTAQQMMTQISVDHSDLSREIASQLPQVQAKLAESFGLHASIEVHHSGMSFSSDGNQQQSQERGRPAPRMTFDSTPMPAEPERLAMRAAPAVSSEYRLDIQA
jgi:hypothetical protein